MCFKKFICCNIVMNWKADAMRQSVGNLFFRKKAKDTIEMYKKLPGFCEHMKDFYIDKYFVDERCWTEGYVAIN